LIRRGDVYVARLNPTEGSEQAGERPVIVVSRDAINQFSPVVIVVPLTSRRKKAKVYPSQVVLEVGEGGLKVESIALGEQVRAISKTRLVRQLGRLSPHGLAAVAVALRTALDL